MQINEGKTLQTFLSKLPTSREDIADWIRGKDDCAGFFDISLAVRRGDIDKAQALCARYRSMLSDLEVEAFKAFGLLL